MELMRIRGCRMRISSYKYFRMRIRMWVRSAHWGEGVAWVGPLLQWFLNLLYLIHGKDRQRLVVFASCSCATVPKISCICLLCFFSKVGRFIRQRQFQWIRIRWKQPQNIRLISNVLKKRQSSNIVEFECEPRHIPNSTRPSSDVTKLCNIIFFTASFPAALVRPPAS